MEIPAKKIVGLFTDKIYTNNENPSQKGCGAVYEQKYLELFTDNGKFNMRNIGPLYTDNGNYHYKKKQKKKHPGPLYGQDLYGHWKSKSKRAWATLRTMEI
ncbi:hypothetical protein CHS0354_024691 [Potamilus streckersoni]|uniref:Uncharacterized protein n=1 Tax=Potamilus streckersoni TaxID=2493646 RepID=A0AAE0VKE5_9BIVA|nr:hypothetical protein CHS0354_024691 [Potamilus streckersoni]